MRQQRATKERSLAGALLAAVVALLVVTPSLANADRGKQTRPLAQSSSGEALESLRSSLGANKQRVSPPSCGLADLTAGPATELATATATAPPAIAAGAATHTATAAPGRPASYAETRYRVSTTPDRSRGRLEADPSRCSRPGYEEPSSVSVVGSSVAPKNAAGGVSRIAELRAKVGDLQEAWHAYQARPDSAGYSLARWKRSVDTLRLNFKQGRLGQTLSGLPGEAFETPYGWRFVDVAPATEVKTGYATLSKFVRRQILKDVWLRRNVAGYTPLWEFRGTASAPLLERLRTFGIPYRFQ